MNMSYPVFNEYAECIDVLQARERLEELRVISYPHCEKRSRGKTHRSFVKRAYPSTNESKDYYTSEDFAKKLRGIVNG